MGYTGPFKNTAVVSALPVIWYGVILVFSVLPLSTPEVMAWDNSDKAAHFAAYVILAFLILNNMTHSSSVSSRIMFLFTLILGVGCGILIELVQWFIPYRSAELYDIFADAAGVFTGGIIGRVVLWRK